MLTISLKKKQLKKQKKLLKNSFITNIQRAGTFKVPALCAIITIMLETKIFLSYLAICLYYTICRLHYLIALKEDDEYNEMMNEICNYIDRKKAVVLIVCLQLFLSPILAPLGMIKNSCKFIYKNLFQKKE